MVEFLAYTPNNIKLYTISIVTFVYKHKNKASLRTATEYLNAEMLIKANTQFAPTL